MTGYLGTSTRLRAGLATMLVTLGLLMSTITPATAVEVDPVQRTWMRTDKPVADGSARRTWMWGPIEDAYATTEEYAESPDSERDVVYFDKSRMEVTDPAADRTSIWYVTNGLLVVELVSGRMQVGDDTFEQRTPATENVAGDPNDSDAPTYATVGRLRDAAPLANGAAIVQRIDRQGVVTNDPSLAVHGATAAERVTVPGIDHRVASPFWTFMRSTGSVYEGGQYVEEQLFDDPFYATGLPITEAYWARVLVGGTPRDVLMQCFERRCLTYTPGNPAGFVVEAGNVGQHYYRWRYGAERPEPERLSVTFRIIHDGQHIATTVTHETFFEDVAAGNWETSDASGSLISTGTLTADHTLTGIDAFITQDWPLRGSGDLTMRFALGLGGIRGSGELAWTANTSTGVVTGTTSFTAEPGSRNVWNVTIDEVPPVLFGQ